MPYSPDGEWRMRDLQKRANSPNHTVRYFGGHKGCSWKFSLALWEPGLDLQRRTLSDELSYYPLTQNWSMFPLGVFTYLRFVLL